MTYFNFSVAHLPHKKNAWEGFAAHSTFVERKTPELRVQKKPPFFSLPNAAEGCSIVACGLSNSSSLTLKHKHSCGTGLVAPRHVGSSRTKDHTHVSCMGRWISYHWATKEAPNFSTCWWLLTESRISCKIKILALILRLVSVFQNDSIGWKGGGSKRQHLAL